MSIIVNGWIRFCLQGVIRIWLWKCSVIQLTCPGAQISREFDTELSERPKRCCSMSEGVCWKIGNNFTRQPRVANEQLLRKSSIVADHRRCYIKSWKCCPRWLEPVPCRPWAVNLLGPWRPRCRCSMSGPSPRAARSTQITWPCERTRPRKSAVTTTASCRSGWRKSRGECVLSCYSFCSVTLFCEHHRINVILFRAHSLPMIAGVAPKGSQYMGQTVQFFRTVCIVSNGATTG